MKYNNGVAKRSVNKINCVKVSLKSSVVVTGLFLVINLEG